MDKNTLSVNTEKMQKGEPGLRAVGAQAGTIFSDLYNMLINLGAVWGSDATGQAFLKTYATARNAFFETMTGMTSSLSATADQLLATAKGFQTTEEQNAASIPRGDGSGGGGSSGGGDGSGGGSSSGGGDGSGGGKGGPVLGD